jgi:hypothetical protein
MIPAGTWWAMRCFGKCPRDYYMPFEGMMLSVAMAERSS